MASKGRAKNTASMTDMEKLVTEFGPDIERWQPTADVKETVKTWHAFLLRTSKLTPRISEVDLAKVGKKYAPGAGKLEVQTWAKNMSQALSFCRTQIRVKKKAPWTSDIAAELAKYKDQGFGRSSDDKEAKGKDDTGAGSTKRKSSVAALYGLSTPSPKKAKKNVVEIESTPSTTAKRRIRSKYSPSTTASSRKSVELDDYHNMGNDVIEVDYNDLSIRQTFRTGVERVFPLVPGPKGFLEAQLDATSKFTSDITNADYWSKGGVMKKPVGRMPKPAAAAAMRKPARADEELENEEDADEDEEKVDEEDMHPLAAMPKPAAAMRRPAALGVWREDADDMEATESREFDHTVQQFEAPMYYKNHHCIGLRVKRGRQLLSFGGKWVTMTKEALKKLGAEIREKLNQGKIDLIAAKAYAQQHLR